MIVVFLGYLDKAISETTLLNIYLTMECETCSSPLLFQVSPFGFRQFGVGDKPWTLVVMMR